MLDPTEHEPQRKVMMIDTKSFYASCECVALGMNPMKTMLIVMSQAENTNGGLVLAASPMAKKNLGIKNVDRRRDVPDDPRLIIKPPRMNYYIAMNKRINDVFREYVGDDDLQLYSIDESLLDVTSSWEYLKYRFGQDLTMKKLARIIQLEVKNKMGLYLTVGIGENPVMAKLALDLEAKKNHSLIGEWHYETVPAKLWPITDLTDVWSIGKRTAKTLNRLGIVSMRDLAFFDPYRLKKELGVRGNELTALAWGVDRSIVSHKYHPKENSISNSQVLPRDYYLERDIKTVIREIGEQVASRLRSKHKMGGVVSLYIGSAMSETVPGFSAQTKISPTNNSQMIVDALYKIFDAHYEGQVVRNIGVSVGKLEADGHEQLDLFIPVETNVKQHKIDSTIDDIRHKFGTTALVKLSSKSKGGTMIQRAGLVGGHNGGNAYG
ncbi:DNA polymerase V [Weissella uvarum]|uniref:Y-family DNA polymerase n=1 Tax=Weissella uvarum TaxID=1479233 RepID=UPI00195FA96C|nr:Y-family DNA polymerase [Weissella uvarum]MBM7617922.1 DNA polymerase V [Weissella uvarum]MCM0596082.1 Y-family DNA polymerase [Weissella uvarum]